MNIFKIKDVRDSALDDDHKNEFVFFLIFLRQDF